MNRVLQNALVGCGPLESVLSNERKRVLRHTPLTRPNAFRIETYMGLEECVSASQLLIGLFGHGELLLWHWRVPHRFERRVGINQQRHDRMIERRCRSLDLSALGEFSMKRDYLSHITKL